MDEFRGHCSQIFPKSKDPSQSTQLPPQLNTRDTGFAWTHQVLLGEDRQDGVQAHPPC